MVEHTTRCEEPSGPSTWCPPWRLGASWNGGTRDRTAHCSICESLPWPCEGNVYIQNPVPPLYRLQNWMTNRAGSNVRKYEIIQLNCHTEKKNTWSWKFRVAFSFRRIVGLLDSSYVSFHDWSKQQDFLFTSGAVTGVITTLLATDAMQIC